MEALAVLLRSTAAGLLEQVEQVPPRSAAEVKQRDELRRSLSLSAAARVAALLAASDTSCPHVSPGREGPDDAPPFGDELTTDEAAQMLGCNVRTVRRRCHGRDGRPALLRFRVEPVSGAFLVSSHDVDRLRGDRVRG